MRDWALHNNDKILVAAVLSRLDTLPAKSRPFKAVEFADSVVGDEFKQTGRPLSEFVARRSER